MQLLNIKAAALVSGISEHTLRAWEKRYGAVAPQRTDTGRRLYSRADVDRLRLMGLLTEAGHAISGIANLSLAELEGLLRMGRTTVPAVADSGMPERPASEAGRAVAELKRALERFELDALAQGLTHAKANFGTRAFVLDVVSPLMAEIGDEVAADRLSISQEHLLSANLRDQLGPFYQSLRAGGAAAPGAPRLAFCAVEGDFHEFGILLSAILAAARGAQTEFLGPNLPAREAARAVQALRCDHLVVAAVPLDDARAVPLDRYLAELDGLLPAGVEVWVGGPAAASGAFASGRTSRRVATLDEFDRLVAAL